MAIKIYKPTSPGRRDMTGSDLSGLSKARPQKRLTRGKQSSSGRNNQGRITSRFRGSGVKRRYRQVDFLRDKEGVPAKVAGIEYDPNRTAYLALLNYADGEKRYILAPKGLSEGDTVMSGPDAEFKPGNAMPLKRIPVGLPIHNVELTPGRGGALARSAGQLAQVRAREEKYVQVRLPSGEIRLIRGDCKATIGQVGNIEHENVADGKAGRRRYRGRRPHGICLCH